ncbi:hypothetical protein ACIBO2_18760 [Nonomuraea sp. NPDC050022]|uniref:hypothetical protein n=1 Tax=unclassified Nonomuraea TaxID=2593643 RepID=UPI0033E08F0C
MIRAITRGHSLPTVLIAGAYTAAVLTLTWLTTGGYLGDRLYGSLFMAMIAFPLSLVASPLSEALKGAVLGPNDSPAYWEYSDDLEYALMSWPGIVTAVVLVLLLTRRSTRLVGLGAGWVLNAAVILAGVSTAYDQWAPRRPYGWPFLVFGLIMAIGLITAHLSAPREAVAEKV